VKNYLIQEGPGIASKAFNYAKKLFKGDKQKTTGTEVIDNVAPNVPKTKGEKVKRNLRLAVQKSKTAQVKLDNTIFRIEQEKKRLRDMQKTKSQTQTRPGKQNLSSGGRAGFKRGTGLMGRKSNVDKIKKTFGTLSVRAGIDNNPNPTYADKIAGAKMKNKNKKKKKFV
jgi:hypothetical protein